MKARKVRQQYDDKNEDQNAKRDLELRNRRENSLRQIDENSEDEEMKNLETRKRSRLCG